MNTHVYQFRPGDQARLRCHFEDEDFNDNAPEQGSPFMSGSARHHCTFSAGQLVEIVHSDLIAATNCATGGNVPFTAITGTDQHGDRRTVILPADLLAPAGLS